MPLDIVHEGDVPPPPRPSRWQRMLRPLRLLVHRRMSSCSFCHNAALGSLLRKVQENGYESSAGVLTSAKYIPHDKGGVHTSANYARPGSRTHLSMKSNCGLVRVSQCSYSIFAIP